MICLFCFCFRRISKNSIKKKTSVILQWLSVENSNMNYLFHIRKALDLTMSPTFARDDGWQYRKSDNFGTKATKLVTKMAKLSKSIKLILATLKNQLTTRSRILLISDTWRLIEHLSKEHNSNKYIWQA